MPRGSMFLVLGSKDDEEYDVELASKIAWFDLRGNMVPALKRFTCACTTTTSRQLNIKHQSK